ncbi:YbaB/EbfC family nucleoid-associated protein [Nocardia coubleae]|uniref:YbaB/EbfC family nucleoid-associated protein n=1 Tax=Nocardia coubleae TaxID=356147 RepID=A0A846WE90_9NOCA|nr:YbaB/EbfC family nucleoid-associated protein [Nocardia coubleae]NKX90954.1 YbaB/EbfC family nucleoid-associated protein [Nocardia coubleae]
MGDVDPVSGQIERLQRALTDARGTATSADGTVRVEVGANGTLHRIELGVGGEDLEPRRLVETIVELHRQATVDASASVRDAVASLSSDPRLREDRQEIVDQLARPPSPNEGSSHAAPSAPAVPPNDWAAENTRSASPRRVSLPGPTQDRGFDRDRKGGPGLVRPPSPSASRTAPESRLPSRTGTWTSSVSPLDPVTFLPTASRHVKNPEPHVSGTERSPLVDSEFADVADRTSPEVDRVIAAQMSDVGQADRDTADSEPMDSIAAWGDPADESDAAWASWPQDDYVPTSWEWWALPSTD